MSHLVERIRSSVIGAGRPITTPFGKKPLIYADYTASGRSLDFIEDYIREDVLPCYANTHTETSFTGAQTSVLREQARDEIRKAVNAGEDDRVIFCGAGATAAINKLLDILELRLPHELNQRYGYAQQIPAGLRPVVFIGPYEHHSNELPWRESIADVVVIPMTADGQICLGTLAEALIEYADRPLKMGSFSAASNVTGIKTDIAAVTRCLKAAGALAFWDYAAAGPYVAIDMNADLPIDAAFISPHKFVGGPGTPGVLVAKRSLLQNPIPAIVGGGTVSYVTPRGHSYIEDHERREEGGTPGIVESIRAGLVFKLQSAVGVQQIEALEQSYVFRAMAFFDQCPNIELLGSREADRLAIVSLRFKQGPLDLHYGFVVSLLNDLFGIQVRGGCSCAGPYGHSLLGIDAATSRQLESQIAQGINILRPGWVRLNFNYFIGEAEFDYLLEALRLVAELGHRLLPYYQYDGKLGVWRYQGQPVALPADMTALDFAAPSRDADVQDAGKQSFTELLELGRQALMRERPNASIYRMDLPSAAEALRWFALPQEVNLGARAA